MRVIIDIILGLLQFVYGILLFIGGVLLKIFIGLIVIGYFFYTIIKIKLQDRDQKGKPDLFADYFFQ